MPEGVNCSVSNCVYWEEGNNCAAASIDVRTDAHAGNQTETDVEFADEGWVAEYGEQASAKSATCCHTFKDKRKQVNE
ncbi:DUF1540 domain-containing protein [Paenibacillus thermoaerophilus]|uniref:DUF1540 domain-containing protein n=1 Tax=Paenibacillus thermoaerophilus TaxID=1215385 RepID=A0ABW2UXN2_9BACL|nr:DUF1540 domain-containing protein [Paenibacillus thermoaerophilus]TMV19046.1 DUF1540 domain-containing protein [Paenibacillus thermoaerophilus]